MTIGKKLALGFAVVLSVLGGIVAMSFTGVGGIVANAQEVIYGNSLDAEMTQKEVDHLNWVGQINELLSDKNVATLDIETDDHQCGFGKWLYSDARKEAEKKVPGLAAILKEIEEPHRRLHESAIHIGDSFIQADLALSEDLQQKKIDHLMWASEIGDVLIDTSAQKADVETDSHKCAFGKWLYSDEVNQMRRNDSTFDSICSSMEGPHDKLHASAIEINKMLANGLRDDATKYYMNNTKSLAHETCGKIDEAIKWNDKKTAGFQKANEFYAEETVPNLHEVQESLAEAREMIKANVMTQEAMLGAAQATTDFILGMGKIGESVKILLDIDKVLGGDELSGLEM